jgi:hypothetical protein
MQHPITMLRAPLLQAGQGYRRKQSEKNLRALKKNSAHHHPPSPPLLVAHANVSAIEELHCSNSKFRGVTSLSSSLLILSPPLFRCPPFPFLFSLGVASSLGLGVFQRYLFCIPHSLNPFPIKVRALANCAPQNAGVASLQRTPVSYPTIFSSGYQHPFVV